MQKSKTVNENLHCDIKNITKNNISEKDFNIIRADIKINDEGQEQKFLANIKFKFPETYLVSIRSRTGIEAARALISKDTILINDRFNKKLYVSSGKYISEKYGISFNDIPLIFGDIPIDTIRNSDKIKWEKEQGRWETYLGNRKVKYLLSCRENKMINAELTKEKETIEATFTKFKRVDSKNIPGKIRVDYQSRGTAVEIDIVKINFESVKGINFTPGKDFERVLLK